MAALTIQNIGVLTGVAPAYSAATATTGDTLPGGQGAFVHVKNGSASSINVTVTTPENVDGDLAVADRVVAVAATSERMIPVAARYNDAASGVSTVTCSAVTTVTIGAFRGPVQA